MSRVVRDQGRATLLRASVVGLVVAGLCGLSSCGLPGPGNVRRVDAEDVPYRLLESASPAVPGPSGPRHGTKAPAVFWVDDEVLRPVLTDDDCAGDPEAVVAGLLVSLGEGPSEEQRVEGRSSAIPTDFGLELTGVDGATATVDIEPTASLGADQLPVAVAQIVLTVTSAPGVVSVVLTTDGEPLQVPLPDGVLVGGPVTARDYAELLPVRLQDPGAVGCSAR